ncbi:MAG: DUF1566 domain-containing protein [Verrucomicrobiota bacterium]
MKTPFPLVSAGVIALAAALLSAHGAELQNMSTRALVGTGENVLIPGFVVSGPDAQQILLRAVGPSLANFGVSGPLADPTLTLYRGTEVLATNDNWSSAANAGAIAATGTAVGAFPLPAGSKDAAVLVSLSAGAYTAVVSGVGNTTGIALVELYAVGSNLAPLALRPPVVDTSQAKCFNATSAITAPSAGAAFYGQDAQFSGTPPSYTKSSDGLTVKDNVTGLTWQQSHYTGQVYWGEAQAVATAMNAGNYGGYSDWRLPTIKELYSIWNANTGWPFIDTSYFTISYASQDELSHAIFWSSNMYSGLLESTEDGASAVGAEMAFGVNFGTGHIKAYSFASGPRHLVRCVRGETYGTNSFLNRGDGTITDQATGLMWAQTDSGSGMDWERAFAYAQTQNAANYLGHSDWRLPNAKELQSLVDYTRSPGAKNPANVGPAIDPLFKCTGITNETGAADYPWYWTSTTNPGLPGATTYDTAWYVAFGRAVGSDGKDLHGAGAVRFDGKVVGSLGGQERYYNYVRLVRDAK